MKIFFRSIFIVCIVASYWSTFADVPAPVPISAEQAFDAVQKQIDPISKESANVVLVDVRTRAEYFWVGAACQVDEIKTINNEALIPDYGKVILEHSGKFLAFEIEGNNKRIQTKKIEEISLSPIAINIPYYFWDEDTGSLVVNENFSTDVEELQTTGYDILIFFCRSGGRSEMCLGNFNTSLFQAIYEIDQPDGKSGRGGFEGTSYSNSYNGYRGFPERLTEIQDHSSVSWKDAGLPIKTSINPLSP